MITIYSQYVRDVFGCDRSGIGHQRIVAESDVRDRFELGFVVDDLAQFERQCRLFGEAFKQFFDHIDQLARALFRAVIA